MIVVFLAGVVVLLAGGCACVWWAARGGPRWARAVAFVTLALSESASRTNRTRSNSSSDD